jgi:hypothetical protein
MDVEPDRVLSVCALPCVAANIKPAEISKESDACSDKPGHVSDEYTSKLVALAPKQLASVVVDAGSVIRYTVADIAESAAVAAVAVNVYVAASDADPNFASRPTIT